MPKTALKDHQARTPLARLRRDYLFHKDGKRFFQGDLAIDLGVSPVRVQQLELGQEPLPEKHALRLQEIYHISAGWLMGGKPTARPVTPDGRPYSRAIASQARLHHVLRSTSAAGPQADLAGHLALSLEALLAEIRSSVLRTNREKGLTSAAELFADLRDAVLPELTKAADSVPAALALHAQANFLLMSDDDHLQWRLDLTRRHLGAN